MNITKVQMQMLRTLDGKIGGVEFPASRIRTIRALQRAGMVKVQEVSRNASTYNHTRFQVSYRLWLTAKAQDMAYNGEFDK